MPLGIVTQAERAHVGEASASVGSTIYDDDRLSTEAGGVLRISNPALTLQLDSQSILILRRPASSEGNVIAELASGTLVFSIARTGNILVVVNDASIRAITKAITVAHIRIVNRKELRIYAQRGALEFSYHGESERIAEGESYRALLDPSETGARVSSDTEQARKRSSKWHSKFVLLAIGVAAGMAIAIPALMPQFESPDSPGPPSSGKLR